MLQEAAEQGWTEVVACEILDRLRQLEQGLTAHFRREEEGGFLEEATASAPRFSQQVEELMGEHKELLDSVRALLATAQDQCASKSKIAGSWEPFENELSATLQQLLDHETRENGLLQRAFNIEFDS